MTSIEVWIAMNEDGDYEVAKDEDDVVDLWNENVGGLSRRLVRLRVTMSAPAVSEADVNVPEEAGQAVNVEIDRQAVSHSRWFVGRARCIVTARYAGVLNARGIWTTRGGKWAITQV